MKNQIKIQCPAKINLDLRVFPKTNDNYHPIKSIMQTINLFDYVSLEINSTKKIALTGTSSQIPYDEKNLCYKAAKLFFEKTKINHGIKIHIEKNIPIAAGLAGGSTDAAGVLFGLNKMFDNPIKNLSDMALELGADVPFCLKGSTQLCTGRGEKMVSMPFFDFSLVLIKPKDLQISAKEAYDAFDDLKEESHFRNDLEFALINKYKEINYLHSLGLQMSGSGPTFFLRSKPFEIDLDEEKYLVIKNLNSINHGVVEI